MFPLTRGQSERTDGKVIRPKEQHFRFSAALPLKNVHASIFYIHFYDLLSLNVCFLGDVIYAVVVHFADLSAR